MSEAAVAGNGGEAKMRVWRGDAGGGEFRDYTVPLQEGMVVLDVIHAIQAMHAGDLAVRWNCKAGKCGSCSAEVNGKPRLMCMTRMNTFEPGETITVAPIKTFPLIRDLVTDVSYNYEKAKTVPPFKPKPKEADGTRRMYQEDIDRVQEFHKCIECFLCQNVCHVIRDHDDNKPGFAGTAFCSCGWRAWRCTRSTPTTGWSSCATRPGWASATSPSAAPRSARSTSRSPTTPSSP